MADGQQEAASGAAHGNDSDGRRYPLQQADGVPPLRAKKKDAIAIACVAAAVVVATLILLPIVNARPGEGSKTNPATSDVTVQQCDMDGFGFVHAKGTIFNHSSKTSDYHITIRFVGASGNQITEGVTQARVQPGHSAGFDDVSAAKAKSATCVLADVIRLAP